MVAENQRVQYSEVFDDIRNVVYGAWRYRWKGLGLVWLLSVFGWLMVMSLPNIYEGSSRVFIDTSSTLGKVLAEDVVRADTVAEANIMVKALTSRPSLRAIASRSGLVVDSESANEVESAIQRLRKNLEISIDVSQVLQVTYEHPDPETALSVVSQIVDSFIEGLLGLNRSDSDLAQEFLEEQLAEYENLLQLAETRLAEFKKENIGQMPDERGDYFTRFRREQEVLNVLNFQLELMKQRQAELDRQITGETPVFGLTLPTTADLSGIESPVRRQIQAYEQELAILRLQYTDSHPDILRINSILEDLRAQRQQRQSAATGPKSGSLEENPVYQSMKIQLSTVKLELLELQAKRANQARMVNDLRSKVDIIPDIEAKLTRLNRDYEVNKSQYDALLRRLETARMTEAAENSKTHFDFRVIDPPSVTPSPIGPNRGLFVTVVLVLSIGAGTALAVFLSFMRPVFFSTRSLEQFFGIHVLGGIGYIASQADIAATRRNRMAYVACLLAVVSVYALVVSFSHTGAKFMDGLLAALGSS